MSAVEQLETLVDLARDMGYEIRHDVLGGSGGGACEFGGRKVLFIDLSLSTAEQIHVVRRALCADPQLALYEMTGTQESALRHRSAA